ncbi:MAG: division/cell wall cluster transcriptional repressor MraZ [Alloprevotella sp.]
MPRFSGVITAKLDAKGRVFFPSAFRRQLQAAETEFVLKKDIYQPCLVIYPLAAWQKEVDEVAARLNRWNPGEAMLFRQFLADAETITLDGNGRFLISRRLQDYAKLDHEVAFVGVDDRVEVWAKAAAEQPFVAADDYAAAFERAMGTGPLS